LNKLDPNSYLLTFSPRSLQVAEFVPFAWRINYFRAHIWPATSPELVFNALFSTGRTVVIYLSKADYAQLLTAPYQKGYLIGHLLDIIPPLYSDTKASIYNLQAITPPAENSYIVLVMPENYSAPNSLYAYDIMSMAGYNYTTSYMSDLQTLSQAKIVVVPSETLAAKVLELKNKLKLNFNKIIVLNLDGCYGELAQICYLQVNASVTFGEAYLQDMVYLAYLNFYPIIDIIKNGSRELYPIIGDIIRSALGNLSSYTYKDELINAGNTVAFREAAMQGNVTMGFESIIVQIENTESLEVIIDENITYRLEGNGKICPANFRNAVMKASYMEILPGSGFYIKAFVQNATLTLYGEQMTLALFLDNRSIESLKGKMITIRLENVTVLLRKPLISVEGRGSFKNLYAYRELKSRIRALGDDCEISGYFTFTGIYGDSYSIVKHFDYVGNAKLSEPLYRYDEWRSFVEMLPYLLIVAISYLVFAASKISRRDD
ncbi:MAG: hypothetical protein QW279_14285, partial [Candidatus Jordarchaeaceae archaeon]